MQVDVAEKKETDIGDIPTDWEVSKIIDVCDTTAGGTPSRKKQEYYEGEISWFKSGELNDGLINDSEEKISQKAIDESSAKLFAKGAILIAMYGATAGKTAKLGIDAATNQAICAIFPDEAKLDGDFLQYNLIYSRNELLKNKHGGAQSNLNQGMVKNHQIPLPALREQQKIASTLTTVRNAIEQTEAVIQATRELKKSMMKHLFTYGPVPVDQTDQVELEETDIGQVPKKWGVKRIGDVTNGTQYGINKSGNQEGEYPVLRMSNQSDGRIYLDDLQYVDLDDQEFEKYQLKKGEILFNRTNSFELVGKTSIFDHDRDDIVFASYLVRVFPDKDGINPYFLNYYMNKESTQRRLKTVATRAVSQSNINATKLRNFEVPVPDSETQDKIVSELKTIDSKIEQEKDKKIALESLFDSLLENLMTAKVRVV